MIRSKVRLLKYPYPFQCWVTISNDPDNTNKERWDRIHEFFFEELGLPWANSVFPFSYNTSQKDQVNLKDFPEIAIEPIDTIHTWGDFVLAGEKGFSRHDAQAATLLLKDSGIQPLVWVDHSRFVGNMVHRSTWGAQPLQRDASGWVYNVPEYTLDQVNALGIRYLWDGEITSIVGQDRELNLREVLCVKEYRNIKGFVRFAYARRSNSKWGNAIYRLKEFPDGNKFYTFRRFGSWSGADIIGLADILSDRNIQALIKRKGAMIAYTHLGKSRPGKEEVAHIPERTKNTLLHLRGLYVSKVVNFSSVSHLLDYLVIRDNIKIIGNTVHFNSDQIRFPRLNAGDINKHQFGFVVLDGEHKMQFTIDGRRVKGNLLENQRPFYTLQEIEAY